MGVSMMQERAIPAAWCWFLVLAVIVPQTRAAYRCGMYWSRYNDNCYRAFTEHRSWHEANELCIQENATLIDIRNEQEQHFLSKFPGHRSYWIGLQDLYEEGKFRWISDGTMANYTKWREGEPNHLERNYAVYTTYYSYSYQSGWADRAGGKKTGFICDKYATFQGCPSGWKPFTGRCYMFNWTQKTWQGARDICRTYGADLAKITDQYINKFIGNNVHGLSYWIGLRRRYTINGFSKWVWLDDVNEISYENWNLGMPNNGMIDPQNCMAMRGDWYYRGMWRSYSCSSHYYYLCQRSATSGNCQEGWRLVRGICYFLNHTDFRSWDGARQICRTKGGDLATITDGGQQRAIDGVLWGRYYVMRGGTWAGLRRSNGRWTWVDSNITLTYRHWYPGEPSEKYNRDKCVVFHATSHNKGSWDNVNCEHTDMFGYICEMPKVISRDAWLVFHGHCYQFNNGTLSWKNARRRCQSLNADLVVIESEAEQSWIETNIEKTSWIGLNSLQRSNVFTWLDTTITPSFTHWGFKEPNARPQESCVETQRYHRLWNNVHCVKRMGFICKKRPEGAVSFYDFKYKSSVYKIGTKYMKRSEADAYCNLLLGHGSGLAKLETGDEWTTISEELDIHFSPKQWIGFGGFWIGDTYSLNKSVTTLGANWDTNYPIDEYGKTCLFLHRTWNYNRLSNDLYETHLKLRNAFCCLRLRFICEKHTALTGTGSTYYDFAHHRSVYRIISDHPEEHKSAHATCRNLLSGGYLVKIDSTDELNAISRELRVRHLGKVLEYWIGGNPRSHKLGTSWTLPLTKEQKCMFLVHTYIHNVNFEDSAVSVYPSTCNGTKRFICERKMKSSGKGFKQSSAINAGSSKKSKAWHASPVETPKGASTQGPILVGKAETACNASCTGLAISLPLIIIVAAILSAVVASYYRNGILRLFKIKKYTK